MTRKGAGKAPHQTTHIDKIMKLPSTIEYKPSSIVGFHHTAHHALYAEHDEITALTDCPFPVKTGTFEVLAFGRDMKKAGDTFSLVQYIKPACGHMCEERIPFQEGVETFEHHGTTFGGPSYSIANWQKRINFFRCCLRCPVCQMAEHCRWIYAIGQGPRSRAAVEKRFLLLMNSNYANWENFITLDQFKANLAATKYDCE